MTEHTLDEQDQEMAVSEQSEIPSGEEAQEEQKMVPLAAMLATRKKLQEAEMRASRAEAERQAYHDVLLKTQKGQQEPVEEEDPQSIVEKRHLHEHTALTKREILETLYQDMHPKAVQEINTYLKPILEQKPWLAASIDTAQNRYARAHEIVQDYIHLVEEKPKPKVSAAQDAKRIVENSQKPRSPVEVGKSARPEGLEYLKSMQGKKEFREYRQKVLRGEA